MIEPDDEKLIAIYILKSVGWLMAYPLVLLVLDNCLIIPKEVSCARVYKVYIYINLMSNDILENQPNTVFFLLKNSLVITECIFYIKKFNPTSNITHRND